MSRRPASILMAVLLLVAPAVPARSDTITLKARPVPLDARTPERTRVGRLEYHGGLVLTSPDQRLGGLSGLLIAADGDHLIAISDRGYRLDGRLVVAGAGWLVGVADATIEDLRGPKGGSLVGTPGGDAEDVTAAGDGGIVVAFESRPRLWIYPASGGPPMPVRSPPGLERAPRNAGIETLTRLPDGRLLALGLETKHGNVGWVEQGAGTGSWSILTWRTSLGFVPTGAAVVPGSGEVLVLERRTLPPAARIRLVPGGDIVPGALLDGAEIAHFDGSLTYDNMEGIATHRSADGETLVYLVSDDNYSFLQRTLLMMFRLVD
jgi:hypothetical protein